MVSRATIFPRWHGTVVSHEDAPTYRGPFCAEEEHPWSRKDAPAGTLPLGPSERRGQQRSRLRLHAYRLGNGLGTDPRLRAAEPAVGVRLLRWGGSGLRPGGSPRLRGCDGRVRWRSNRVELWGSFHFLSVGLAVGAAWLVSVGAPNVPGWPLGAFVATAAYLVIVGTESTVADR